jgi:hypothetical protein
VQKSKCKSQRAKGEGQREKFGVALRLAVVFWGGAEVSFGSQLATVVCGQSSPGRGAQVDQVDTADATWLRAGILKKKLRGGTAEEMGG